MNKLLFVLLAVCFVLVQANMKPEYTDADGYRTDAYRRDLKRTATAFQSNLKEGNGQFLGQRYDQREQNAEDKKFASDLKEREQNLRRMFQNRKDGK